MSASMRWQQRLSQVPQRVRAILLHVIHTRSTNDLVLQQPQLTHGLNRVVSEPLHCVHHTSIIERACDYSGFVGELKISNALTCR